MRDRADPAPDHSGQEILRLGALVLVLGIAFVTLLVEPTQASAFVPR